MNLGIAPVGNRIIIEQDVLETTTESGIVLQLENEFAEQAGQVAGTVMALGDDCYYQYEKNWCKVGDRVLFAKFAGKAINDVSTGKQYLVMNDIDIVALINEEN